MVHLHYIGFGIVTRGEGFHIRVFAVARLKHAWMTSTIPIIGLLISKILTPSKRRQYLSGGADTLAIMRIFQQIHYTPGPRS